MPHTPTEKTSETRIQELTATRLALIESCICLAQLIDLEFDRQDPFGCAFLLSTNRRDPILRAALNKALDSIHRVDAKLREIMAAPGYHRRTLFDPAVLSQDPKED